MHKLLRLRTYVAGLMAVVGVGLAATAFPDKVSEAYANVSRFALYLQRPAFASLYADEVRRGTKAASLLATIHPNTETCIISTDMGDLVGSGDEADMVVVYDARFTEPESRCGETDFGYNSLAVFVPKGLSYNFSGGITPKKLNSNPSEFRIVGPFVIQYFYGTDFPWVEFWYLGKGKLNHTEEQLDLTDNSEHEYVLQSQAIPGGMLFWGPPRGLFHMIIAEDGQIRSSGGFPPDFDSSSGHAVRLDWDGHSFGEEFEEVFDRSREEGPVIKVSRLDQLYVSGCEPLEGFTTSALLPGALLPIFELSPVLRCGGNNEDDFEDIRIVHNVE
ncbi:MAG: hypothetical protein WAS21_17695 [Geminicoccaceae bacterium]